MVSDSGAPVVDYPRTEWGSLISLQDGPRKIADVNTPTHVMQPLSDSPHQDTTTEGRSGGKRSSVIEMWRKREKSLSSTNLKQPVVLKKSCSDRGFHHMEEKKHPTPEEFALDGSEEQSTAAKQFPELGTAFSRPVHGLASPTNNRKETVVSPNTPLWSQPLSHAGNTWKDRESSFDDGDKLMYGSFTTSFTDESPASVAWPDYLSKQPDASRSITTCQWGNNDPEGNEAAGSSPMESPKRDPALQAAPVTPEASDLPAFNDLKSKWAKFGERKIQAREESKVPLKIRSPVVQAHKVTPNNSQRRFRSIDRGHDESSIDGEVAPHTLSGPRHSEHQNAEIAHQLQQPLLEERCDDIPIKKETTEQPVMSRQNQTKKQANAVRAQSTPAKKVSTYMYVKDRSKVTAKLHNQNDATSAQESNVGTSHATNLPKRLLQKKLLLDRQRRRSKAIGASNQSVQSNPSSEEDALNDAFQKAYAGKDSQPFTTNMAETNVMPSNNPAIVVGSNIPIKALMAFGSKEDEFIGATLNPRNPPGNLTFNSDQELHGYDFSKIPDNADDQDSTCASLPSKSCLASRAQKSLRDKRNRTKPLTVSPDRTSVPLKQPNYGDLRPTKGYYEDEMMFLDKEEEGKIPSRVNRVINRPNRPSDESMPSSGPRIWGGFNVPVPSDTFDESVSASTTSHMLSTITSLSDATSFKDGQLGSAPSRDSLMDADDIVTDQFVSQSNANVEAFTASFQALSLAQFASDLKEEAGTVLKGVDFKKLSNDWNEGVAAASQSLGAATQTLNKLVGKDVFPKKKNQALLPDRIPSPVEEIAIEVEYVEDSDDGEI